MDLVQLAERSAAITGDFLLASVTGAAGQASSAAGAAVVQLVMGRLGLSPATSETVPALRAAPDDPQQRSEFAAVLRDVLAQDPGFASSLSEAVQAAERNVHVVADRESFVTVDSPVTAHGRGTAIGRDQHNTKHTTKKTGALWAAAVAAIAVLGGGTTFMVTQSSPESSSQEQAEKAAVDFVRAGYNDDVETMCGLTSPKQDGSIAPCRTEETMQKAIEDVKARPVPDEKYAAASRGWKAEKSNLPSHNTALVTTINNQIGIAVVVHLTHESGDWRVIGTESARIS